MRWRHPAHRVPPKPGPIRKILTHLSEPLEPPAVTPARGPPTDWGELVQAHFRPGDVSGVTRRAARDRHPQPLTGSHATVRTAREKRRAVSGRARANEPNPALSVDRKHLGTSTIGPHPARPVPAVAPHGPRCSADACRSAIGRPVLWCAKVPSHVGNLRTHAQRIIGRAGLNVWPKPFQNMRSSCGTDWLSRYPVANVAQWMGHSRVVSMRHYAQALPEHFAAVVEGEADAPKTAAHFPAQSAAEMGRNGSQPVHPETDKPREPLDFPGFARVVNICEVGATGFEPATSTSRT